TAAPPNTVFCFTANDTRLLEDRFLSRCKMLRFSTDGLEKPLARFLEKVWRLEMPKRAAKPSFRGLALEARLNIRAALQELEMEMIAVRAGEKPRVFLDAEGAEANVVAIDRDRPMRLIRSRTRGDSGLCVAAMVAGV